MPGDANAVLQAAVTKTASFNSAGFSAPTGFPINKPLWARIIYSAANTSSGAGAATLKITESSDNSTFGGAYQTQESALTLSTTAISGELWIPIVTQKPYVRLELTLSGTGATITYSAKIMPAKP